MVVSVKSHLTGVPHKQKRQRVHTGKKASNPRYTPTFVRKLEDELSGRLERGVRPPIVRIPVKTHLSTVLLTNNPWEQRDLDRKLAHIKKEKARREKALEWNQRHFFVQQIFDQDYHLRFTAEKETKPSPVVTGKTSASEQGIDVAEEREVSGSDEVSDKLPEINMAGRGIFSKPLQWNLMSKEPLSNKTGSLRRASSMPIRQTFTSETEHSYFPQTSRTYEEHKKRVKPLHSTTEELNRKTLQERRDSVQSKHQSDGLTTDNQSSCCNEVSENNDAASTSSISFPNISNRLQEETSELPNDSNLNGPTRMRKSYTTLLGVLHEVPSSAETTSSARESVSPPRLYKATSLPQINLKRSYLSGKSGKCSPRQTDGDQTTDTDAESTGTSTSRSTKVSPPSESICDDKVITRITRTLPISLMVRANQNMNKIMEKKKGSMLQKCRDHSKRNMFADPRWHALEDILVSANDK